MDNILDDMLNDNVPSNIAKRISQNMKQRRLDLNLTQALLSKKSGVSFGTLKRFETSAEISLKSLLQLAISLNATELFNDLFKIEKPERIDDILKQKREIHRKRARINV
jgi:transcriptional regulator with XRE-family HTH domain